MPYGNTNGRKQRVRARILWEGRGDSPRRRPGHDRGQVASLGPTLQGLGAILAARGHAHRVDLWPGHMAVVVVDGHKAVRIGYQRRAADPGDAGGGRQHHRIDSRQGAPSSQVDAGGIDPLDSGARHRRDLALREEPFQQTARRWRPCVEVPR